MEERQIVVFRLGEAEYGLDIMLVQEIIRPPQTTKLPGTPEYVLGICNLRGKIIPIIDLKTRFDLEKSENNEDTRVIIKKHDNQYRGYIVDAVNEVLRIESNDLGNIENEDIAVESDFIDGVIRLEDRIIIMLNITAEL